MKQQPQVQIQFGGLVIAFFIGALATALGASLAWSIVIGLGTVPALLGALYLVALAVTAVDTKRGARRFKKRQSERLATRDRRGF